jgi:phosphoserine phosphatase RsbU/P
MGDAPNFHLAIIESLPYQVAVIDRQGLIIATNRTWNDFCLDNGGVLDRCGTGINYLDVATNQTKEGINLVLQGKMERYVEEYPCHSPNEKRWFILGVTPFRSIEGAQEIDGAVVTHLNITERKLLELAHEKELELARELQSSVLVPALNVDGISIQGVYRPSNTLSGDMYAWYQINETQFGIILLDIVGHGVSSSLISMSLRALLAGVIRRAVSPVEVYKELNGQFNQLFNSKVKYCTGIYLLIDTKERSIQYVNAGSPNGLIVGKDRVSTLDIKTVPIGMVQKPNVNTGKVPYYPGDSVLLYTDGLADTLNLKLSECERTLALRGQTSLRQMGIEAYIDGMLKGQQQVDDVTAVAIHL